MLLSIITINYNDASGLQRTLDSVLMQTCKNYEHIVIDGGSTDGSVELIKQYSSNYSNPSNPSNPSNLFWLSEPDRGPFDAMNKGLEKASGDYCIFMNSGDSFYDEHVLEKFMSVERTKDIYTGVACEHLGNTLYQWNPARAIDISLKFFYRGALSHQSSFIKTTLMKRMKYDTRYHIAADWQFFLLALLKEQATYEPLPFFVSHYMDGGISRDAGKAFAERDAILAESFTPQELHDAIKAEEWDHIAQKVDPKSKVGNLIFHLTKFLLTLRR